jgi:hypothetical protein
MKKILFFVLAMVLAYGCAPGDTTKTLQQEELLNKAQLEEIDKIKVEQKKQEIDEEVPVPKISPKTPDEGTLEFGGFTEQNLIVLDIVSDVKFTMDGKLDYKVGNGKITGTGEGKLITELKSDMGFAKCQGQKTTNVKFEVEGDYDEKANNAVFKKAETTPKQDSLTIECPSEDLGDLTYDLSIPILFFVGQGVEDEEVSLEDEEVTRKQLDHEVPDWDTVLKADWTIKNVLKASDFDFDVDVEPAIVEVEQGSTTTPLVTVKRVKGRGDVQLTTTEWPNIVAFLTNTPVTPTETTTLNLRTSCKTKPDSYLFSVTGETTASSKVKTFRSSQDSINLIVKKNPSCP